MKIVELAFTGYPVTEMERARAFYEGILKLEDFDAAVGELRANNVKFVIEPFESPVCRMTIVADPDCNSVCLHKRDAR